jgi:hypothetical protein
MWLAGLVNPKRDEQLFRRRLPPEHDAKDFQFTGTWIWCPACEWCLCGRCILEEESPRRTYRHHRTIRYPFLFDYPAISQCLGVEF